MITVLPCQISLIDTYAEKTLGIPTRELMRRAGLGVAKEIEKRCKKGRVLLFCGGGNNGGDGYAAALFLGASGFSPLAVDVFGKGQKSEAGKFFLEEYTRIYGKPLSLSDALLEEGATVLVDAVFGTGFGGELPREASLLEAYYKKSTAYKVAVDMPLGVDGEKGVCRDVCLFADLTVALCFVKQGMLSYPAKDACGEIALCDLGLDQRSIQTVFSLPETVDEENIAALLPKRKTNTHKGSFGKVLGFVGSRQYKGAALLSAEGALRMGAGLFVLASAQEVIDVALLRLPECLTLPLPDTEELTEADFAKLFKEAARASAILVGCGSGKSHNLQTILYNPEYKAYAPAISRDAITLVKSLDKGVLPLSPEKTKRIMIVPIKGVDNPLMALATMAMGGGMQRKTPAQKLQERLAEKGFEVFIYESPLDKMKAMMARGEKPSLNLYFAGKHSIADFVSEQDLVISLFDVMNGHPSFGLSKGGGEIPWYVHELPVVGISVNKPTMLADCPMLRTYINAYDSSDDTMGALVDALVTGDFRGKDPIDSFCGMWDTKI